MLPAASRLGRVHHVGVACRAIEPVRAWIHATHQVAADSGVIHDPCQRADLCLLSLDDGAALELVSGAAVDGLVERGHSYYHLCYEVAGLDAAIAGLEAEACRLVSPPAPAVLFEGRRVAFLLGPAGLVELLEIP
jgi:methylmalonyl-CoA/ethylmalonyl-CoA epimerase